MRPYERRRKQRAPRLRTNSRLLQLLGPATPPVLLIWRDMKTIWFKDPPFPAGVRVVVIFLLACALLLPLLYLLVPPLLTALYARALWGGALPRPPWPPGGPRPGPLERREALRLVKDVLKKIGLRLSLLVTLSDYIQTFRALGLINL